LFPKGTVATITQLLLMPGYQEHSEWQEVAAIVRAGVKNLQ